MNHLYAAHCELVEAIIAKDIDKLQQLLSNHIYGGFSENAAIVLENSNYFTQTSEED